MFRNNATNRTESLALPLALTLLALGLSGCRTGPIEYVRNGFKVGPNYQTPAAPVESAWIDDQNSKLQSLPSYWDWWRIFRDPYLETLVQTAHQQNLTLRQAGFRIQEARARREVARGNLFPQFQQVYGSYQRRQISHETGITAGGGGGLPGAKRAFDVYTAGGQFAWELDFWGRFRRAIIQADAELDSTVENYDNVMVIMIGDVAEAYVDIRVAQQRIRYAESNVRSQSGSLQLTQSRRMFGAASDLDVAQAVTNVAQTEANIPQLRTDLRRAENRLCILLGIPPQQLAQLLNNDMPIPGAPPAVAIGVPADLLRRRPDVRRAERLAAAQSERIGITEAAMYPAFAINGNLFVQSTQLTNLFAPSAVAGNVGPSFTWNLLNYGRIWNTTNAEEALFLQLVTAYQQQVLVAQREAEDAIVGFLNAQEQARILRVGVEAAIKSRDLTNDLYKGGKENFNRVFVAELFLSQQQDSLAVADGAIAANLVDLFRALGGGWELRLNGPDGVYTDPAQQMMPEHLSPLPKQLPQHEPFPSILPNPDGPIPGALIPGGGTPLDPAPLPAPPKEVEDPK